MLNIDKAVKTSVSRWNRRSAAEAKTPHLIEHRRGWKHPRLMRLGQVHILDWGDGPRLDYGSGIVYGMNGLNELRIPTDKDAEAIDIAIAKIIAATQEAERLYLRAFKRGRRPSVEEIRQASDQVRAEAPE